MIGAEIVGGVESLAPSGAPNDVWRRNNDPKTRLFFDSSEPRDANEPVLWKLGGLLLIKFVQKSFSQKNISGDQFAWIIKFQEKAFQNQKVRATERSEGERRRTKSDRESNPITKFCRKIK